MAEFLEQQRGIEEPGGGLTAGPAPAASGLLVAAAASAIPEPYETSTEGDLSDQELGDLATCEAAVDNLRVAFWAAGKALQVIRDARLYRSSYATFEEYVEARWDMSRPQAYRLIDAWPLAERLSPMGDINERQIRELIPLATQHGEEAAATVYQAISETDGAQVTAALLHGAVAVLPRDHFDPAEAVSQIRAYLAAGPTRPSAPAAVDPVALVTAEATRLRRVLHRAADHGALKAAAHEQHDAVRKVIADMRALLDEIEQGTF
jgi:hypothetical protein